MSKQAITIEESIGANATVNVLAGTRFENVQATGFLLLAETGAATGLNSELFVGSRNAKESSPVGGQNRFPIIPDDVAVDEVDAMYGEKIQLRVANTTGAPIVYQAKLILDDSVMFTQ